MTNSPFSRLATSLVTGLVSIAAQTFAGVKTFASKIVATIGLEGPAVWNTNGTGASDVGMKAGFSTADGSVNGGAKPFSVRNGINGTEVEIAYVDSTGGWHNGKSAGFGKIHGAGDGNQYMIIDATNGVKGYYSGFTFSLISNFDVNTNIRAGGGDFEALSNGKGFICQSPNGTRYRITVSNAGAFVATAL